MKNFKFDLDLPYRFIDSEEAEKKLYLLNHDTGIVELIVYVTDIYPFRSPKLFLSDNIAELTYKYGLNINRSKNYNMWLSKLLTKLTVDDIYIGWIFTLNRYHNIASSWSVCPSKETCLCCKSFTCDNNWSPGVGLYDIACEYILKKTFMMYTTKLMLRYLYSIQDCLTERLNTDLAQKIFGSIKE